MNENTATEVHGELSETVPTVQYGNVKLGPFSVTRKFSGPLGDEDLKEELKNIQNVLEGHIAEERRLVEQAISGN